MKKYNIPTPTLRDKYVFAIFNNYEQIVPVLPIFYVDFCIDSYNSYQIRCNCIDYYKFNKCIHLEAIRLICDFVWEPPTIRIYAIFNTTPYSYIVDVKSVDVTRPLLDPSSILYDRITNYIINSKKNNNKLEVPINAYKKSRNIEMRNV